MIEKKGQFEKINKYNGNFSLTKEEEKFLNEEILKGKFTPTSSFKGVEKIVFETTKIPTDILKKIKEIKGEDIIIDAFIILKIKAKEKEEFGIPIHLHDKNEEVYFGGDNGTVILLNNSGKEIGEFELNKNTFTTVSAGEQHGIKSQGKEIILFAVIFNSKK